MTLMTFFPVHWNRSMLNHLNPVNAPYTAQRYPSNQSLSKVYNSMENTAGVGCIKNQTMVFTDKLFVNFFSPSSDAVECACMLPDIMLLVLYKLSVFFVYFSYKQYIPFV